MPREDADKKYILAIDHGTSGAKTSLFSARGELVAFEYERTPICFSPGGGAEQDPEDWWNAIIKTSRRLIDKRLVPVDDIVAVCCSSTFSSTVAVGADGRHLMNSLTWMDSRAAPYIAELMGGFPSVIGYNVFNILKWISRTAGGPQLSGKDDIAHAVYIKRALPDIYNKTHMFMGSKDYINLRLTGQFAASYDSMMLFWVTDTRDINNMRYDDGLLKRVGVEREKMPPMRKSIDILGNISKEVADQIGIRPDVKVVMGSPDHQSAGVGSGAVRDFEGHIYIGTSSWIQCIVPFKKTDMLHSIASLPSAIPGKYYCANEQDIAGGCLSFLADNLLFHRNRLQAGAAPPDVFKQLDEIASLVPPGSHKLIFTPWLNGERTPVDDNEIRGGIYNMSMTSTTDDIIRAFMEGVAFNSRWALQYVEKFISRKMDTLNMIGGGAKSDVWCQIFADILNRTIKQVKDPMQSNARGAAFIASVALGYITFDDIPSLIQFSNTFKPNPANRAIYVELFDSFIDIYKNNKKMFKRLNRIRRLG